MNSVVIQPDNLTIEKDDQVKPRWYQMVYDPHWLFGDQSPHHSDLYEDCSIEEAEGRVFSKRNFQNAISGYTVVHGLFFFNT